jgi:hypothetical protein
MLLMHGCAAVIDAALPIAAILLQACLLNREEMQLRRSNTSA